jgi:hypothetical protein
MALHAIEMDVGGHLRLWLMRHRTGEFPEVRWLSSSTLWGVFPSPSELIDIDVQVRLRFFRLIGLLGELKGGGRTPLAVRAFAEAALIGASERAMRILDLWVAGQPLPLRLYRRCDRIQRRLAHRVRTVLQRARQESGSLWLMDLPAPFMPFAMATYVGMLGEPPQWVHSGGDRLWPGVWTWVIDQTGEGEVLRRSSAGILPFERASAHREAFEPTSGGPR